MNKVILQPAGNKGAREHYNDTINNPVSIDRISKWLEPEIENVLREIYPTGICYVWGTTPGGTNYTKWNRISRGDVAFFSRDGGIYSSGVVTFKIHNIDLAKELWGVDEKGQTWEYLYFLDELKQHHIPYLEFNKVVGYADNYIIQGFSVLDEEKSQRLLKGFDLESETFYEDLSQSDYTGLQDRLDQLENTESEIRSKRRLEQGFLKRHLFGRRSIGKCGICNREFPVSLLVTAHIKKRHLCSESEKKTLDIVMPMCSLGCDSLFEKGFISIREGKVVTLPNLKKMPAIENYIKSILGSDCAYFSDKTEKFFLWHCKHHNYM